MMRDAIEWPPKRGNRIKSKRIRLFRFFQGLVRRNILEPSRGGTGRRLNKARLIFRAIRE